MTVGGCIENLRAWKDGSAVKSLNSTLEAKAGGPL